VKNCHLSPCCSTSTSAGQQLAGQHEKAKVQLAFPFPSIFLKLSVPFGTSKGILKKGKGAGKEEFSEHWIFLLLLATPHEGT